MKSTITLALVCLLGASHVCAQTLPVIEGKFTGNGKEAKLAFLTVKKGTEKGKEDRMVYTFSEKDPKGKGEFAAMFGELGSALQLTVKPDGSVVGCYIAHSAHDKGGFNSIGELELKEFKNKDGVLEGKFTSGGEQEAFGKKWEVNLKFKAKAP